MRRALALLVLVPLAACGGGASAPLGQLEIPVAVAVHQPTNQVFVANQGSDELKVFDPTALGGDGSFVLGPAVLFALSIPTVPRPAALGAGARHVFVLSRTGAEVGFVDLEAPESFGPRSIDGPDGFPITQALPFLPTTLAAFSSRYPGADGNRDYALVAGLSSTTGGTLVAVRPPDAGGEPALVARIDLPEEEPADIALDPSGEGLALDGPAGPVEDCRAVAVADDRSDGSDDHEPGLWLTRVAVSPEGLLRVDGTAAARSTRLTVPVPLTLLDGTTVTRSAPILSTAFVPAPLDDAALAAVAADPCAVRSGRLVAVLDGDYCDGADSRTCPDVAMIDLPSGQLATDLAGGPALYAIPGSAATVRVLAGPFAPARAFRPVAPEGGSVEITTDDPVPTLALVVSSDGDVYYFAPGFGSYLRGPAPADRAAPDAVFAVDADEEGPRLVDEPVRTDARRRTEPLENVVPGIETAGRGPRDETWRMGFLGPFPGLGDLPPTRLDADNRTVTLPAATEATFLAPVRVLADADPARADRLVPADAPSCPGFPVTEVSADGRTLTVAYTAPGDACSTEGRRLAVVPARATPWWLAGSVTGFVGRLPPAPVVAEIRSADAPLFSFTPPPFPDENVAAGATWSFATDDGFTRYGAFPDTDFSLPGNVDAWLRASPSATSGADWRVFVPYAGGDALIEFDPEAPPPLSRLRAFQ